MPTRRRILHLGATAGASVLAMRSGGALADAPSTVKTPVDFEVPRGACDCHVHMFADPAVFPFPPAAPIRRRGLISWHRPRAALGHQFLPPALKKKLGKVFRFAPAVTSSAEECRDLAEADVPEPAGAGVSKGST